MPTSAKAKLHRRGGTDRKLLAILLTCCGTGFGWLHLAVAAEMPAERIASRKLLGRPLALPFRRYTPNSAGGLSEDRALQEERGCKQ